MLAAEAQQVNVGVARAQSEHAIAVLIGRPPAELTIAHGKLALDIPRVPIRVPSELLERRPDIAAAERTMQEQNAAIGVAFAGYYPSLTLNGAFGYVGRPVRQGRSPAPIRCGPTACRSPRRCSTAA